MINKKKIATLLFSVAIILNMNASGLTQAGPRANTSGLLSSVLLGPENIFVSKDGNDATGTNRDIAKSYLTITAALAKAATLTPSATNLINIIVYPGTYVESFEMLSYINLISAVPPSQMYNGVSYSTIASKWGGAKQPVYVNGNITLNGTFSPFPPVPAPLTNCMIIGINCNTIAFTGDAPAEGVSNSIFKNIVCEAFTGDHPTSFVNCNFVDCHAARFFSDTAPTDSFFQFCTSSTYSWGGSSAGSATTILRCTFIDCIAGPSSWSSTDNILGNAGGLSDSLFIRCKGTEGSFAAAAFGAGGTIDATTLMYDCEGAEDSYSASTLFDGGTILGKLYNCKGGIGSFAQGSATQGLMNGELINPILAGSLNGAIIREGLLRGARIDATGTGFPAVRVGNGNARIEYCQLKGDAGQFSVDAGAAGITADVRHSDLYGGGYNAANITLATATPYNTDDVNSYF